MAGRCATLRGCQLQPALEERGTDIFDQLSESRFPADYTFRCSDDIVAVRQKTSVVCGGVGCDVEDVPNIFSNCKWTPLQRQTQAGCIGGQSDHDITKPCSLGS